MRQLLKVGIHIFSVLAALILLSGCHAEQLEQTPTVNLFSVSGTVTDADDESPIGGITVTITAYNLDDTSKSNPLYSDSYDTAIDGSYWFMRESDDSELLSGVYYEFSLSDNYSQRTEHYKPAQRSLFLVANSPYYSAATKVYKVENNDFKLSR